MSDSDLPVVCTAIPLSDYARARLEPACDIRDVTGRGPGELPAGIDEAEGFLCGAPYMMGNDILDAAPHLRVIANHGVGFDNVVVYELNKRGIVCCNTPGVLNGAVADLTLGLMVTIARRIVDHNAFVDAGEWGNPAHPASASTWPARPLASLASAVLAGPSRDARAGSR